MLVAKDHGFGVVPLGCSSDGSHVNTHHIDMSRDSVQLFAPEG